MAYFQKTIRPDIIDGDVSKVVGSSVSALTNPANATPFSNGDIVFDWTPIDIPLRADSIVDGLIHTYGENGGDQEPELALLIAKSNNGVAPTTLGEENSLITGCYELPDILIGTMRFLAGGNDVGVSLGGHPGTIMHYQGNESFYSGSGAIVPIEPEHNSLGGKTTNRIWVACIKTDGDLNFRTLVKATSQVLVSSGTIPVDGIDPRKVFRVGDTVYTNTEDTACGTIASMTVNQIVLNGNTAVQIENNEELVNAKPMTITLSFNVGRS